MFSGSVTFEPSNLEPPHPGPRTRDPRTLEPRTFEPYQIPIPNAVGSLSQSGGVSQTNDRIATTQTS
jgi:hypothetical protein